MLGKPTKEMRAKSLALIASVFLSAVNLEAQSARQKPPEPIKEQSPPQPCKAKPESLAPITVQFNLLVADIKGRPREDVDKQDFKIFEDGVPQQLSFFIKREGPLNYGLVVDTSGSLRAQFDRVIATANAFVSANTPSDEMFLIRFISSDKIETVQDWTSDQVLLRKGLDKLFIEGGQSALIDAVYESANHLFQRVKAAPAPRRSGLVLITDGEDRASYYTEPQMLKLVRELNIQVFVIGFVEDIDKKIVRQKATNLLTRLAQESGGHALFPANTAELADAIRTIRQELSGQYFMGYTSTNQTRDNAVRRIRIDIAERPERDKRFTIAPASFVALCQ